MIEIPIPVILWGVPIAVGCAAAVFAITANVFHRRGRREAEDLYAPVIRPPLVQPRTQRRL